MDDNEKCMDLNLRMQSILVRPYILDALSHYEIEARGKRLLVERLRKRSSGSHKHVSKSDHS